VRYYEDYEIGDVFDYPGSYRVTEAEVKEVAGRWDPQPFHLDPEAAKTSIFGGLVASSVHLFAISVSLGRSRGPVAALTALGFDDLRWHAPARPGDTLRLRGETTSKRLSKSRPGAGIVINRSRVLNQNDELVFSYTGAALIACRPPDG
jgi:acyl dehydratase